MAKAQTAAERLLAKLDRLEPALKRDVARAFLRLRRRLSQAQIINAIDNGPFALRALTARLSRDLQDAANTIAAAFAVGAKQAALSVPTQSFTLTNPAATQAAKAQAAKFVTNITTDTQRAIRALIADAFHSQVSTAETAKRIRSLVGLTERQTKAVLAKQAKLLAAGKSPAQVKKTVDAYRDKLLKQRAEMIARTELAKATTAGQIDAWKQARAKGLLGPDMKKAWIVTPDDKLCPICEPLDGETAEIDGLFRTSAGPVAGPPVHPNCRCALGLKRVAQRIRRVA